MNQLPRELLLLIVEYLDLKSLARLVKINKYFYSLTLVQEIWQSKCAFLQRTINMRDYFNKERLMPCISHIATYLKSLVDYVLETDVIITYKDLLEIQSKDGRFYCSGTRIFRAVKHDKTLIFFAGLRSVFCVIILQLRDHIVNTVMISQLMGGCRTHVYMDSNDQEVFKLSNCRECFVPDDKKDLVQTADNLLDIFYDDIGGALRSP